MQQVTNSALLSSFPCRYHYVKFNYKVANLAIQWGLTSPVNIPSDTDFVQTCTLPVTLQSFGSAYNSIAEGHYNYARTQSLIYMLNMSQVRIRVYCHDYSASLVSYSWLVIGT